ncbi:hypothetical protein CTAM01_06984 [Colletotrichum tamarilloi]|uniref:Uncharacterized protein n=1 Tax=Colletotrichum tamarilloi TaxID=1209934 RepID=A0ABQ9RAQ1_9PEZI|nr:uncharacterized protein CTAM01_06984 [Colletotrichum tamarilloi]KAK1499790.1 hypothetical protein CTAM01_06984 [Colletotrichum tamarilloi]
MERMREWKRDSTTTYLRNILFGGLERGTSALQWICGLYRPTPSMINTMFNTILKATLRLYSHLATSRMIFPELQTQSRTARTIELHECRPINTTKTLSTPFSSAQEILEASINCNQSRFGSPHQDNPFQGFIRGSSRTKAVYRYEAPRRKAGQQATSSTTSSSYLPCFGNFGGLFTHVVEALGNPREHAINRWTDREEEIERLPENQGAIIKRLQAVERRQELHSYMAYCIVSGFVFATALLILVAFAAREIRGKGRKVNSDGRP